MNITVNRFFSKKHNPVDILIIDGKNRAIVTQVAIFGDTGKMTHCEWRLVRHSRHKEHLYLLEDNTEPSDIFNAIEELNKHKRSHKPNKSGNLHGRATKLPGGIFMWNSVKEKVPDEYGRYLVFSDGAVDFGRYYSPGKWYYPDSLNEDLMITHWMPLPSHPGSA